MSALARQLDRAARPLAAERLRAAGRARLRPRPSITERVRVAGRLRRADAGTVTEMTRSLLRDARAVGDPESGRRLREADR